MNAQLRKAAILIVSLDRLSAEALLSQMPKEFAKRVLAAAKQLGKVDPAEQQSVMRDFLGQKDIKSQTAPVASQPDVELSLSHKASSAPEATSSTIVEKPVEYDPPGPKVNSPARFSFVTQDSAESLASILSREQPRLAALILAHLPAEQSASVLAYVAGPSRLAIVECIADLEETATEVLDELEQELKTRLLRERLKLQGSRHGLAALSGILQASDPELRSQISAAMGARRAEKVVEKIAVKAAETFDRVAPEAAIGKEATFPETLPEQRPDTPFLSFSSFMSLDDISLAAVFGSVSPQTALLALVGADESLVRRILRVLPRKEAASFRKRLEEVGPLRLKEVEQAQSRLSQAAGELLEQRRITLPVHERARLAA